MLFADVIGAPHEPEISFGVMWEGILPNFTEGDATDAFTGTDSDAPQPLLSGAEAHGSNIDVLLGEATGDRITGAAGFDMFVIGDERLNADEKFVLLVIAGDETDVDGGAGGGAGDADVKPEKSSAAKRSFELAVGTDRTGATFVEGATWVEANVKLSALGGARAGTEGACTLDCVGFESGASKKLPPTSGGGDVTCGAEGVALTIIGLENPPRPEKAFVVGCIGGDLTEVVLGKLKLPNASVRPPNESDCAGTADAMPPKDSCRP